MVELSNKVTKEEWVRFQLLYSKYLEKKRSKTTLVLITICLLVSVISGIVLFSRIEGYLIDVLRSFVFPIRLRRMITFELLFDRIMFTGVLLLLFLFELSKSFGYQLPDSLRKKKTQSFGENEVSESHICFTDEAIWSYSVGMDIRLNWEFITEVFKTEEVIVFFARDGQRIVISKGSLTERRLHLLEEQLARCFKGAIVQL